jgi:hypothetical protein
VFYPYEGYNYALILVDVFSSKLFAEPLKTKQSKEIIEALKKIFLKFKAKIYKFERHCTIIRIQLEKLKKKL